MRIDAPIITGSFSLNGDALIDLNVLTTTGSNTFIGNQSIIGAISASALTGSIDFTNLTNSPTLVSGSSQVIDILSSLNSVTASFTPRISNLESKSASVDISITNINLYTSSQDTKNTTLGSYTGSNDTKWTSIGNLTGSYATTGSNTFFGTQTYSGSVYIANDLIVQGSSSIQYISASSVSIGTNIVQLNTANPSVRFAGLTIIDSGSIGGSGSFLYDSVHDEFVFVHRGNGTNVTSSHFVLGPETYDSLGNETYLTCNVLTKGTGKEHLVDSCIFDNGTTTCIKNNLVTTGTACFASSVNVTNSRINLNGNTSDCRAVMILGDATYPSGSIVAPNIGGTILIAGQSGTGMTIGTTATATFSSDIVLSAANPVIYGGTAVGSTTISNIGGQTYAKFYGASHATTPNVTAFVNAGSTSLTISACGNVGIGITTPAELLEVSGSLKIGNLKIQNSNGGRIGFNRNTATGAIYNCCYSAFQINGAYDNSNYLDFQNYNSSGSYIGGFVLNNGNVGICTSSPATLLANTSTRPANADGLSIHLYGLDWAVNGQGYAATIWNTSATTTNYNAGLLVRICSTDVTDRILDLESGGVNRFRMLGTGAATFNGNVTVTNNNWLNFTDSAATARNILTLASDNNLYLQYRANCNFYLRDTDGNLRFSIGSTGISSFACRVCINVGRTNGTDSTALILQDNVSGIQTPGFGLRLAYQSNSTGVQSAIGLENGGTGTNNESQISFYTQNIAGGLCKRLLLTSGGDAGFSGNVCAVCLNSYYGVVTSNSVITKSIGGIMQGVTATYFDFPTWDDAGQGQMLEIKAFFDHFYNWNYGAHYYVFLTSRDSNTQALTMFSCGTGNGGSWMAYKTSSTNLRVCKIAGSYGGGGAYWIQVTAKQP